MRRRRKTRYTWFPTVGTETIGEGTTLEVINGRTFTVGVLGTGAIQTIISPLTFDTPVDPGDVDATARGGLVLTVGDEYVVERIVGKCFVAMQSHRLAGDDPTEPQGCLVGAGFFVGRANDTQSGGGNQTPIGSATEPERRDNYSPLSEDTVREPWMWRRTWILGNRAFRELNEASQQVSFNSLNIGSATALFPPTNTAYGSVLDGPHIDVKSVRRIRQDERLWFVVSAVMLPPSFDAIANANGTKGANGSISGYLDYRILGALRKAKNRSNF